MIIIKPLIMFQLAARRQSWLKAVLTSGEAHILKPPKKLTSRHVSRLKHSARRKPSY